MSPSHRHKAETTFAQPCSCWHICTAQCSAHLLWDSKPSHYHSLLSSAVSSSGAALPARMPVPAMKHVKGTHGVTACQQKQRSWITLPRVTATAGVHCKRARPAAGFRAPQPERLNLSCRTGFAEGKGMKLSLPGFGYMTQEILNGLKDPNSHSLLASRHQMSQPAESTQRSSVLTQNGTAKARWALLEEKNHV